MKPRTRLLIIAVIVAGLGGPLLGPGSPPLALAAEARRADTFDDLAEAMLEARRRETLAAIAAIVEFLHRRGHDPLVTPEGFDLAAPVDGPVTSRFGMRAHPILGRVRAHNGVDLRAASGTPVRAAGPGVVTRAEYAGAYGNLVVVSHGERTETRYAHLSGILVQEGAAVLRGGTLGTVGSTGLSTGPHLHFEIRVDGSPVDPAPWLPRPA